MCAKKKFLYHFGRFLSCCLTSMNIWLMRVQSQPLWEPRCQFTSVIIYFIIVFSSPHLQMTTVGEIVVTRIFFVFWPQKTKRYSVIQSPYRLWRSLWSTSWRADGYRSDGSNAFVGQTNFFAQRSYSRVPMGSICLARSNAITCIRQSNGPNPSGWW